MAWHKRRAPKGSEEGKKGGGGLLRKFLLLVLLLLMGYAGVTMVLFSQSDQIDRYPWKWSWPDDWKAWSSYASSFTAEGYQKAKEKIQE